MFEAEGEMDQRAATQNMKDGPAKNDGCAR